MHTSRRLLCIRASFSFVSKGTGKGHSNGECGVQIVHVAMWIAHATTRNRSALGNVLSVGCCQRS